MILTGANFVEVRISPPKRSNRIRYTNLDAQSFTDHLVNSPAFKPAIVERRGGGIPSVKLEHRFWLIGQDPYVKNYRKEKS